MRDYKNSNHPKWIEFNNYLAAKEYVKAGSIIWEAMQAEQVLIDASMLLELHENALQQYVSTMPEQNPDVAAGAAAAKAVDAKADVVAPKTLAKIPKFQFELLKIADFSINGIGNNIQEAEGSIARVTQNMVPALAFDPEIRGKINQRLKDIKNMKLTKGDLLLLRIRIRATHLILVLGSEIIVGSEAQKRLSNDANLNEIDYRLRNKEALKTVLAKQPSPFQLDLVQLILRDLEQLIGIDSLFLQTSPFAACFIQYAILQCDYLKDFSAAKITLNKLLTKPHLPPELRGNAEVAQRYCQQSAEMYKEVGKEKELAAAGAGASAADAKAEVNANGAAAAGAGGGAAVAASGGQATVASMAALVAAAGGPATAAGNAAQAAAKAKENAGEAMQAVVAEDDPTNGPKVS